ncbi:MAG TPA: hypothetical protein VF311_04475 [Terriglobales bacterium]
MKPRLIVACGAALGSLLLAAGLTLLATRAVQITFPPAAGYPETTIAFRVARFGGDHIIGQTTRLHFASPEWAAKLTGGSWKRGAGGSYLAFACKASSSACMQATKGTGTYRYVLFPFTAAAPSTTGEYRLVWDVQPPGDFSHDATIVAPEPASFVLIASGAAMLAGVAVRLRRRQRK